jgi:hypothetical protein
MDICLKLTFCLEAVYCSKIIIIIIVIVIKYLKTMHPTKVPSVRVGMTMTRITLRTIGHSKWQGDHNGSSDKANYYYYYYYQCR